MGELQKGVNMDWKNLFAQHILERGYDYYRENAVINMDVSADVIQADVEGAEIYEVEIYLDKDEVTEMHCSCPYAEDNRNCKHMAAVLYKWEEKSALEEVSEEKEDDIQRTVENADIAVVRSFLTSVLKENEKLLVRFNSIVGIHSMEEDVRDYMKQVDGIVHRYCGRNHFIDYYAAGGFISELEEIYDTDVRLMIDKGQYMGAFEIINYIFTLAGRVDMDDSDGGIGILGDQACELWREILAHVNKEEKSKMFKWFMDHLDGLLIDYMEQYVEQIVMEEFEEKEYIQQKLIFTERMIKKAEKEDSTWGRSYQTGRWAIRHLELLEQQKSSREEKKVYCKEHWESSAVRKYYINLCVQAKEYDLALEALEESISLDQQYRGLLVDYHKQKKEIYYLKGDRKAYIEQLWELALYYQAGNLETYKELKQQYTEKEWLKEREIVFEKLAHSAYVDQLYREEKLYDRLLSYVLESVGLYKVQEHTEILKEKYPQQLLQKYKEELDKMASQSGDRKKYQEMAVVLRSMKKIEGGAGIVAEIVDEWRRRYKNRPAMMDELRKLQ